MLKICGFLEKVDAGALQVSWKCVDLCRKSRQRVILTRPSLNPETSVTLHRLLILNESNHFFANFFNFSHGLVLLQQMFSCLVQQCQAPRFKRAAAVVLLISLVLKWKWKAVYSETSDSEQRLWRAVNDLDGWSTLRCSAHSASTNSKQNYNCLWAGFLWWLF